VQTAAQSRDGAALWDAMQADAFLVIIAQEGRASGLELQDQLFPGQVGGAWAAQIDEIYDVGRMSSDLRTALMAVLEGKEISDAVAFFSSGVGAQAIALELSAREAMLDPDIEAASEDALAGMMADGDPRLELIRRFSDANDLIENNVVGALNGNYAFLQALTEGGQGPYVGNSSAILGDVWGQEPEVRENTEQWAWSFFSFAYGPLSDDELEDLIEFSATDAGRVVNTAFFSAFDVLFSDISARLGTAAATFMSSEQL
jgi:hypothetical protein